MFAFVQHAQASCARISRHRHIPKACADMSSSDSSSSSSSSSSPQKADAGMDAEADAEMKAAGLTDQEEPPCLVAFDEPDWLVLQDPKARQMVYLITLSALVPTDAEDENTNPPKDVSEMSRQQILDAVLDAIANPIQDAKKGGRPRKVEAQVEKVIVYRERHQNGKFHFHVALKLNVVTTWLGFRNALRVRHDLASHWSSTHTEFWTAARYGYKTTPTKTEVDKDFVVHTADGKALDMEKETDEPWNAGVRRARRERRERLAHEDEVLEKSRNHGNSGKVVAAKQKAKKKEPSFTKMDFYAMVETEGWKTPAQVLAYAKHRGTEKFKLFVALPNASCKNFFNRQRIGSKQKQMQRRSD